MRVEVLKKTFTCRTQKWLVHTTAKSRARKVNINQRPTLSWCASGRLVLSHSTTPGACGTISLTDLIAPAIMRLTASIGWTFSSDDNLEGGG